MNSAHASPIDAAVTSPAVMNPEHLERKECNLEPALAKQAHLAFTHNLFLYGGWEELYTPRPPFIIIPTSPKSIFTREQGRD